MTNSLGAWKNAPLAYVLAEVRTELISNLKDYHPKIGGRLRNEYPIQRTMHAAKLVASENQILIEPGQDSAWEFATPDNRTGVILRSNGVVLHATAYIDSKDFLGRLQKVIDLVAEEIPSVYVNRLGLRYIDFIFPNKNQLPEIYVDPRLNPDLGLANTADNATATTSIAIYPMENGTLSLRYMRGSGKPELPPDLKNLSLEKSHLMNQSPDSSVTAILDTDRIYTRTPVERLNPVWVREKFDLMHKDVSEAFKKAITAYARKEWGST